jgi:hypothetical protein
VLFERPEGYCNYYASAMAVMARSIGIPARVASGYAVGSASDDGYYHISEANAHSWPELYLGELGWVEFEPTSSQPEISRPVPEPEQAQQEEIAPTPEPEQSDTRGLGDERFQNEENQDPNERPGIINNFWSSALATLTLGILVLAVVGAGAYSFIQWRWKRYLKTLKPGAQAAAEMFRLAPLAGFSERADATADERATQLSKLVPASNEPITNVNAVYVRERYGGVDLSPEEATNVYGRALRVQKQTWRAIYNRFIGDNIAAAREFVEKLKQSGVKRKT